MYVIIHTHTHTHIHPSYVPISKSSICITNLDSAHVTNLRNLEYDLKFTFHVLFGRTHKDL